SGGAGSDRLPPTRGWKGVSNSFKSVTLTDLLGYQTPLPAPSLSAFFCSLIFGYEVQGFRAIGVVFLGLESF
ncbi:MAG: hypothetical protein AB4368_31910, partial [Xenococcaceae cyanobacterium]